MNERIKKLRMSLGLTQQEFGDKIGVKRNTIATYEIGRNAPLDSVVLAICNQYGVSEEWLRDGVGEMFVPDASDELEALVRRYDLTDADGALIEKYVNLKPEARATLLSFVLEVASAIGGIDAPAVPGSVEDAEELYRKSLSSAQSTGSSVSNTTGGTKEQNKKEA